MRSMVEGHASCFLTYLRRATPPVPLHHPTGGPPPPPGEERRYSLPVETPRPQNPTQPFTSLPVTASHAPPTRANHHDHQHDPPSPPRPSHRQNTRTTPTHQYNTTAAIS